ncbi:hypothetical protein RFI_03533 [Reticulomyxa filosa]|uniref:Uncharacterized protein n=1 Tax=Reticulomyxa filosa TaxID=46433 RepID=X6P5T9_RETFI|nr:hypothetical protein RFI_03533 [Reticulomyxa filosa]|eukprot:ETO33571.1 hypothetical protein RFI_03533 [Reticulomyxa filosa]
MAILHLETWEMYVVIITTGLSNLCMLPTVLRVLKRHPPCFGSIGVFGLIVSMCYHVAEALPDQQLFGLDEGQWHRLDNIASIGSFNAVFVYMCDIQDSHMRELLQLFQVSVVVVLQTHAPWDLRFTFFPLLFHLGLFLCKRFIAEKFFFQQSIHQKGWNRYSVKMALLWLIPALFCFVKGLDDQHDYLRIWHGLWHAFIGISCYYQCDMLQNVPLDYVTHKHSSLEV